MSKSYGEEREFLITLNAREMWAAFASNGSKKRGGGKWSLRDFLPERRAAAAGGKSQGPPKTVEHLVAMAKHLNAMWGGTDLTKKKTDEEDDGG